MDGSRHAADGGIRFAVLGPLALTAGSRTAVLQPSKPAVLLAALLLNANTVVPVAYLQRVIWAEPPEAAKAAVQTCVLRLRRLFGKYGIDGNLVETRSDGYRINADEHMLDLIRFRALLRQAYAESDPRTELDLLGQALALVRGKTILGNVRSELLQRDEVPRLTEEWLRAMERVFDLELSLGRCREALAEIHAAAGGHPFHERFREQLIEALYRTGRRAEALAECRRAKQDLREELGIDPGPALRQLELAVLRGEEPVVGALMAAPSEARVTQLTGAPVLALQSSSPGGGAPAASASASGAVVLDHLLRAGLLEVGPEGRYHMNELLHLFTRAAAGEQAAAGIRPPDPHRPTGS